MMPDETPELMPQQGGSYVRNKDGSLTCVTPPTKPAAQPTPLTPEVPSEE
jgi:hypothetical protein